MSPVTRRGALSLLPLAGAALPVPAAALAAPSAEDPFSRVRRLMDELEEALADPAGWNGQFGVRIAPEGSEAPGAWMFNVRVQAKRDRELAAARSYLDDLDAMPPLERAEHMMGELEDALRQSQPGRWKATLLRDDDGAVFGAIVMHHGEAA